MGGAHNIIFSSAAVNTLSANRAFTTFPVNFLVVAGGGLVVGSEGVLEKGVGVAGGGVGGGVEGVR
jgi:hypothetical protein